MSFIFKRYVAFTLAEVLITLGIVGLVAEMTIPTVIHDVQEQEIVARVIKMDSVLNQGFRQYQANNGCIGQVRNCNLFEDPALPSPPYSWTDIARMHTWPIFKQDMGLIFVKDCPTTSDKGCFANTNNTSAGAVTYKNLNGDINWLTTVDNTNAPKGVLADGTSIMMYVYSNNGWSIGSMGIVNGWLLVNVNGKKGPNIIGRDTFAWWITQGGVKAMGGNDGYYTNSDGTSKCNPEGDSGDGKSGCGLGCTAKVVMERAINY